MTAFVETRTLEPGLTAYQISSRSQDDVLMEIERITGTCGDHIAEFQSPRRCFDINDPAKRWRSRGYVRSIDHAA